MTDTYLLDDFKNPQNNLKHITIRMPNKKSGWRVNLEIAGVITKSIALKDTPLDAALEKLFPVMLENKTDLTKTTNAKKMPAEKLKEKYRAALKDSLEEKTLQFAKKEKKAPRKEIKTLTQSIFKKCGKPRYYTIREPYNNTSISIAITRGDYSKNFSLVDHTIKSTVDNTFEHIVNTLDCKYSKSEYKAVKTSLINKLIDKYNELCGKVGEAGLRSKFNSLAGEFYKNGKWTCFAAVRNKRTAENIYLTFTKLGKKGITRNLDVHGFTDAFEEIFRHGCKQVDINPDFIGLQPIKALLKEHLRQQIKLI